MKKIRESVSIRVSEEELRDAVRIVQLGDAGKFDELSSREREVYKEAKEIVYRRIKPLADAVRKSERIGGDYDIRINI